MRTALEHLCWKLATFLDMYSFTLSPFPLPQGLQFGVKFRNKDNCKQQMREEDTVSIFWFPLLMTRRIGSFWKDCVLFPPTILMKPKHKIRRGPCSTMQTRRLKAFTITYGTSTALFWVLQTTSTIALAGSKGNHCSKTQYLQRMDLGAGRRRENTPDSLSSFRTLGQDSLQLQSRRARLQMVTRRDLCCCLVAIKKKPCHHIL